MASLCHPWFTTTNLSYRFPIFETSATALCGTTGMNHIQLEWCHMFLPSSFDWTWGRLCPLFDAIARKHVVMCGGDCSRFHESIFAMTTQRVLWSRQLAFPESGEWKTDRIAKSVSKKCCKRRSNASVDDCKKRFATVSVNPKRQHAAFHTHKHYYYIAHVSLLPSLLSVCIASALLWFGSSLAISVQWQRSFADFQAFC